MSQNPGNETDGDTRLEQVQGTIDDARSAAKDLADHDVIDPDAVEGQVPRETDDASDDTDQPTTDQG